MMKITCRDLGIDKEWTYKIPRFLFPIAIFFIKILHDYIEVEMEVEEND